MLRTRGYIVSKMDSTFIFDILAVCISILLCCQTSQCDPFETNDIESYVNILDKIAGDRNESKSIELVEDWGVPDQTATVGRLYQYALPEDVLPQPGASLKVVELGGDALPGWLQFDPLLNTLMGVPTNQHLGAQHYLHVTPGGAPSQSRDESRDTFSITVVEDSVHETGAKDAVKDGGGDEGGIKTIKCAPGSSVTRATVVMDTDMNTLDLHAMLDLMRNMGAHLDMPPEMLRILPIEGKPMIDSAALVSGSGDVHTAQTGGTFVQWEVGCGNVQAYHMPILQRLETSSSDGTMAERVGHGVVGWHVTNNRPPAPHRLKRHARRDPAPVAMHGPGVAEYEDEASGFWETDVPPTDEPTQPPRTRPSRTRKPQRTKTRGRHTPSQAIEPTQTTPIIVTRTPEPAQPTPPVVMETTPEPMKTPTLPPTHRITDAVINTSPIKSTATEPPVFVIPTEEADEDPYVKEAIAELSTTVGEIFMYKVPRQTFHDAKDGNTRKLKLMLMTEDRYGLTADSWLQFDSHQQTMYGLALPEQSGYYRYELVALDSAGQIARDPFEIEVAPRKASAKLSHEFAVTLEEDYDTFVVNLNKRIEVVRKIADFYHDSDLSKITVTRIEPGSVVFAWTNNSLPVSPCPTEEINELLGRMLVHNDTLNPKFEDALKPYRIKKAGAHPKGACADNIFPTDIVPEVREPEETKPVERDTSSDDLFISTVVPAIIIAAIVIIALIIIFCLYRQRRKGKLSDEDHRTFVGKGVPVIFADELDDKRDPSKPLMASDTPPLPPPEYPRGVSPGSSYREPLLARGRHDELYNRPPPVNGSASQPSHDHPTFSHPPPYTHVPP